MVILRDLLLQPALPAGTATFQTLPGAGEPTLSQKNWTEAYHEVRRPALTLHENPNLDTINTVFGDEDALDAQLLNRDVNPLNGTIEWFQKEGDSVRTFYTHVSHPIQLAFQTAHGTPFIVQRSESGPLGSTQVSQTIDFTWGHGACCLMIGELKKHKMINPARWKGDMQADNNRVRLGKELRG
ncbi:hypothetical protein C7999DRAFT_18374 [Corynascus novoguineensis]|uniref:Uncharacterized protein n=1 Tax=Corynascus novoguineensis TaxID=1126955 RepID=A0AAN7CLH8_9PEZI|nr:hypothetical protein C7999DRAFT_18374 [Corynascus novoguineensis]